VAGMENAMFQSIILQQAGTQCIGAFSFSNCKTELIIHYCAKAYNWVAL
jgi:hypothetical protein